MEWVKLFETIEEAHSSLSINKPRKFTVNAIDYCIFKTSSGLYVTSDRCSHEGASMSLGRCTPSGLLECPWHQFLFEPDTGKCTNHTCNDLSTFEVKTSKDGVWVEVD